MTTLKKLIEERTTITAYCALPCEGKRDLDLKGMAKAYGEDFDLTHQSISHRLRCHACNTIGQMTIRIHQEYHRGVRFDDKGRPYE